LFKCSYAALYETSHRSPLPLCARCPRPHIHSTQCRAYASAHLLQTVGSRMNSFCFESVHNDKATYSSQVTTATIPGAPCHVVATLRRFNKMRSPTPRGLGAVPLPSARAASHAALSVPFGKVVNVSATHPDDEELLVERVDSSRHLRTLTTSTMCPSPPPVS
jgi:hypothetical protein